MSIESSILLCYYPNQSIGLDYLADAFFIIDFWLLLRRFWILERVTNLYLTEPSDITHQWLKQRPMEFLLLLVFILPDLLHIVDFMLLSVNVCNFSYTPVCLFSNGFGASQPGANGHRCREHYCIYTPSVRPALDPSSACALL